MKSSLTHRYVYLLESQGLYKIGFSHDPEGRRKRLQTGSPFPVRLVHTIRSFTYRHLEEKLHGEYRRKKVRGEWFALTDEDVARIKTLDWGGHTPEENAAREESDRQWHNRPRTAKEPEEETLLNALMGNFVRSLQLPSSLR